VNTQIQELPAGADLEPVPMSPELERLARLSPRPTTMAQTGLSLTFLADLLGKHLAQAGVLTTSQVIERMTLAGPIVEQILQFMRTEGRVEVRSRLGLDAELRFGLTDKGRIEATEALNRSGYVGPTPVPLADYCMLVRKQSVHGQKVTRQAVHQAFEGIVIADEVLDRLGPALNSRRAIFLYGHAGTGKTFTARRLASVLNGLVLVPHAVAVNETVVEVFDPLCHEQLAFSNPPLPTMLDQGFDPRYVPCERPIVLTGGELSADMLELHFDPATRTYAAPIQLKANNGFLLIDDLGRQRIEPTALFNRWIVPMDSQHDTLVTNRGYHFEVPFDLVLVFSTNLRPEDIADQAFLRRLGYKVELRPIQPDEYRQIWQRVCAERATGFDGGLVDYVIEQLHRRRNVPLLPCHPRDLLGMALDRTAYLGRGKLDTDSLRWAWDCYFLHKELNEFGRTDSLRG
jgi:predicted ATPase with chaperone activity